MVNIFLAFTIFLILLLTAGCDSDRFTGYKYQAQPLAKTVLIDGDVFCQNTNKFVPDALIQIGSQQTLTNEMGRFSVNYLFSSDDQQNKPVAIGVFKQKYYPFTNEKIIFPSNNHFTFNIIRAAPVIDTTVIFNKSLIDNTVKPDEQIYTCQAVITDFQGASTITRVAGIFMYRIPRSRPKMVELSLNRIKNISFIQSYWQGDIRPLPGSNLNPSYELLDCDDEQYSDSLNIYNSDFNQIPLF